MQADQALSSINYQLRQPYFSRLLKASMIIHCKQCMDMAVPLDGLRPTVLHIVSIPEKLRHADHEKRMTFLHLMKHTELNSTESPVLIQAWGHVHTVVHVDCPYMSHNSRDFHHGHCQNIPGDLACTMLTHYGTWLLRPAHSLSLGIMATDVTCASKYQHNCRRKFDIVS